MCEAIVTLSPQLSKQDEAVVESDVCFICLGDGTPEMPLVRNCGCRWALAHRTCLARWQLQQAGKP